VHNNEEGFALVTAIVLLTVMMGLGLGLLFLTDSQQKASGREQAGEIAFNVAEAALNAQTSQLSHAWPGTKEAEYPPSCTATNAAASGCPDKGSLEAGYPITSPLTCPAGQPADPWGSALTNEWTTYVRDNGPVGAPSTLFSSSVKSLPAYDANGDGKVWVRSVGVVQCRVITIVSLISQQLVTAIFPAAAIAANWFETSNAGNKLIINTAGKEGQPGEVSMRCEGKTAAECENYREGQIKPDTTKESKPAPNPAIPVSELEGIKKLAISNNTYFGPGKCPANLSELSGKPVYLEGSCKLI
jgi:Tfp pilus assembly protein PilX